MEGADLCIPPLNISCWSMNVTPKVMLIQALLYCISVLTVILNLLVIISISHFRQLQTPTNLILLSLAVSDFLLGLVVMPAAVITLQPCLFVEKVSCVFVHLLSFILTSSSVGGMVLISVDRYVAICHPLRYSSMITPNRVKICVSLCWFCSVFYDSMILKDQLSQIDFSNSCYQECKISISYIVGAIDLFFTFFGPLTVIIVLYMRIFVVAVSQARAMRSHISAVRSNTVIVKKSELRAARTLGIILLVFILCLCPYFVPSIAGQNTATDVGSFTQHWLFLSNSSLNPLIYAFFYPWFRKSMKLIVSLQILQPGSHEAKIM